MPRMDITLDLPLLRAIRDQEIAAARSDFEAHGLLPALNQALARQDERIASAPDVGTLACRSGCAWCCHFTIDVRPVEVFNILEHVERTLPTDEQARIRAEVQANSVHLRALDDDERVKLNLKCPFLVDHRCGIYAARPQACRNYHATDEAGCRKSYEEPDNLDIDPEFAPGVYQAGGASVEAFNAALGDAGYDVRAYELNVALEAAWSDPAARGRFEARSDPFPSIEGFDVFPEFDDLDD